ncbi:MAG: metal-dependent transcriptional regulator [Ruminococcus sp.]|nr:metal-dependent transcriptional regulator [Ruminococcus sp.]
MTDAIKRYLLAIYELSNGGASVKSTDVSRYLNVTKSSTAKMTTRLEEQGYIIKPHYADITLTPKGIKTAGDLYTNMFILQEFFTKFLKTPQETAKSDAITCVCSLSDFTVDKLVKLTIRNVNKKKDNNTKA